MSFVEEENGHRRITMPHAAFVAAVKMSLAEWPALQLAIDQGMGGDVPREKEEWMADTAIPHFFTENCGLIDRTELCEYIEKIMDDEFDTAVEDGTTSTLVAKICHYNNLIRDGKEADVWTRIEEVNRELAKKAEAKALETQLLTDELINCALGDEEVESANSNSAGDEPSVGDDEEDDGAGDGWTVVGKKPKPVKPSKSSNKKRSSRNRK